MLFVSFWFDLCIILRSRLSCLPWNVEQTSSWWLNFFPFADNFAESDFDYLNNFGSTAERNSLFNRDSVLLKFDPLLSRPIPLNKRLTETREEVEVDDFITDLELKLPLKKELDESFESDVNHHQQLLSKEDEMSLSAVETMKDYSTVGENKTQESTFISEAEDSNKLRWDHQTKFCHENSTVFYF